MSTKILIELFGAFIVGGQRLASISIHLKHCREWWRIRWAARVPNMTQIRIQGMCLNRRRRTTMMVMMMMIEHTGGGLCEIHYIIYSPTYIHRFNCCCGASDPGNHPEKMLAPSLGSSLRWNGVIGACAPSFHLPQRAALLSNNKRGCLPACLQCACELVRP